MGYVIFAIVIVVCFTIWKRRKKEQPKAVTSCKPSVTKSKILRYRTNPTFTPDEEEQIEDWAVKFLMNKDRMNDYRIPTWRYNDSVINGDEDNNRQHDDLNKVLIKIDKYFDLAFVKTKILCICNLTDQVLNGDTSFTTKYTLEDKERRFKKYFSRVASAAIGSLFYEDYACSKIKIYPDIKDCTRPCTKEEYLYWLKHYLENNPSYTFNHNKISDFGKTYRIATCDFMLGTDRSTTNDLSAQCVIVPEDINVLILNDPWHRLNLLYMKDFTCSQKGITLNLWETLAMDEMFGNVPKELTWPCLED